MSGNSLLHQVHRDRLDTLAKKIEKPEKEA